MEYCSLELDIRDGLPAMLQLAAPGGPVVLIWLDKLQDHGRRILVEPECAPLAGLLADPSIHKVGVSIQSDCTRLAEWWGDYGDPLFEFRGVKDLRSLPDPRLHGASLKEMCTRVLGRTLPKRKFKGVPTGHSQHLRQSSAPLSSYGACG